MKRMLQSRFRHLKKDKEAVTRIVAGFRFLFDASKCCM